MCRRTTLNPEGPFCPPTLSNLEVLAEPACLTRSVAEEISVGSSADASAASRPSHSCGGGETTCPSSSSSSSPPSSSSCSSSSPPSTSSSTSSSTTSSSSTSS